MNAPKDAADWSAALWQQFGASIDMLENALVACPEELWSDRTQFPEYWYLMYHTLFWLDFYASDSPDGFAPPVPFTLEEMDPAGILPDRVYTKAELHTYLEHCRGKCRSAINAMTEEEARKRFPFGRRNFSRAELFLYNMRHVQHGAAQLNLILRQKIDSAPPWVGRVREATTSA